LREHRRETGRQLDSSVHSSFLEASVGQWWYSPAVFNYDSFMSYVDENLIVGEQVLHKSHLHWIAYVPSILLAALLLSLSAFAFYSPDLNKEMAWLLLALAPLPIVKTYIICRNSEFAVTDKRVLLKTGVVRRHTFETLVTQVENIGVDQSVLGRLLDYGTITVTGTGATKETFARIAAPLEFRRQVQTATLKLHEQRR
jgi:uncharacterized membrane protein YdbT with pleckstrin-like domain